MKILTKKVLAANEDGVNSLKNFFEEITKAYEKSNLSHKHFVQSYRDFKEAVRYFTAKKGSNRVAEVVTFQDKQALIHTIDVKSAEGEVIMSATYSI